MSQPSYLCIQKWEGDKEEQEKTKVTSTERLSKININEKPNVFLDKKYKQ